MTYIEQVLARRVKHCRNCGMPYEGNAYKFCSEKCRKEVHRKIQRIWAQRKRERQILE
jgi:predicted nucleic acid-binding Zn ribbon protein